MKPMTDSQKTPPPLRPAATVILVRETRAGLQVYLLKRSAKSGFMGGKYVFPGGTLDAPDRDASFWRNQIDVDSKAVDHRLGGDLTGDDIVAYGVAAIRETLEEAGVFLAHRNGHTLSDYERIARLRLAAGLSKRWFLELVKTENWVLEFSQLYRWAQWITPLRMKHRYDTRFFIVMMPDDQRCAPDTRETVHGLWVTPAEGLQGNLSATIPLSPPTLVTLYQLMAYKDLNSLKADVSARQWGKPLAPNMVITPAGPLILEPWDPEWPCDTLTVDKDYLAHNILPPEEPMSRIWLHEGLWVPVKV
jgi:8-oxo-dGTP pyrophosphatase MutT (NUDIX family)